MEEKGTQHKLFAISAMVCSFALSSFSYAQNFSIEMEKDEITIEANDVSVKELLTELERVTGIPVKFTAEINQRVSLTLPLTTVENAIGKITPNHMIVHQKKDGKTIIKELIIMADDGTSGGGSGNSSFLPTGEPAAAVQPRVPENQPTNSEINEAQQVQTDKAVNIEIPQPTN